MQLLPFQKQVDLNVPITPLTTGDLQENLDRELTSIVYEFNKTVSDLKNGEVGFKLELHTGETIVIPPGKSIKITYEEPSWTNELAHHNPHSVSLEMKISDTGIETTLLSDAYTTPPENKVLEGTITFWDTLIVRLEPYSDGDND